MNVLLESYDNQLQCGAQARPTGTKYGCYALHSVRFSLHKYSLMGIDIIIGIGEHTQKGQLQVHIKLLCLSYATYFQN